MTQASENTSSSTFVAPDSPLSIATCSNRFCFRLKLGWMWGEREFAPPLDGATFFLDGPNVGPAGNGVGGVVQNGFISAENVPYGQFLRLSVQFTHQASASIFTVTWNLHTSFLITPTLPMDMNVLHAQAMLNNLGIYAGNADGNYTERTRWALAWFQKNKMPAKARSYTGELESDTMDALLAYYNNRNISSYMLTERRAPAGESAEYALRPYQQASVLRREWFHNADVDASSPVAMDHDPGTNAALTPVWGAQRVTNVEMFPQGASDETQAARLFVLECRRGVSLGARGYQNTLYLPQPVCWLQDHLEELGFDVARPREASATAATGVEQFRTRQDVQGWFGRYTEWGMREFQYYAQMPHVAREVWPVEIDNAVWPYPDRLQQTANSGNGVYSASEADQTPIVCGALNAGTAAPLRYWLDKRQRCPVVVFATNTGVGAQPAAAQEVSAGLHVLQGDLIGRRRRQPDGRQLDDPIRHNLWREGDCPTPAPRIYGLDVSARWPQADIPRDKGFALAGGAYVAVVGDRRSWGGNTGPATMEASHSLPSAAITAADLGETPGDEIFEIVFEMSDYECGKRFDNYNAYDDAVFSYPVYHYTLYQPSTAHTGAARELPGCFAFWRHDCPDMYGRLLHAAGIGADRTWTEPVADANGNIPHGLDGDGTFTATVTLQRLNGDFAPFRMLTERAREERTPEERRRGERERLTFLKDEAAYFRGWHSYWRFLAALRTSQAFRRTVWRFAKKRLQAILRTPFTGLGPFQGATTLGDIFQTRCSRVLLLRAHANRPPSVLMGNGSPNQPVRDAIGETLEAFARSRMTPAQVQSLLATNLCGHLQRGRFAVPDHVAIQLNAILAAHQARGSSCHCIQ